MLVTQDKKSRSWAQDVDCGVNQSWAAVYQPVARRMLRYLDNGEAVKVSTKASKEQVLSPNEPSVNIEHIVRQVRNEKAQKMFPDLQQTRSKRDLSRQLWRDGRSV